MKKTYIAPNAKSIELAYEGLVALSKVDEFDENDKSLSNRRHVSIWDNDEE